MEFLNVYANRESQQSPLSAPSLFIALSHRLPKDHDVYHTTRNSLTLPVVALLYRRISLSPPHMLYSSSLYATHRISCSNVRPIQMDVSSKIIGFIVEQLTFRRILIGRAKVRSSTPTDLILMSKYHIISHYQHSIYLSIACFLNPLL